MLFGFALPVMERDTVGFEPLVVGVMITKGRPELCRRAVRCFESQTYLNRELFIFENSHITGMTIGALRNTAISLALSRYNAKILINVEDDDVSHHNRIASQVLQLQTTLIDNRHVRGGIPPAGAVGYHNLLWWDSTKGEAWMYENGSNHYCLGTSLCYWPDFWKANPFPDRNIGEWPLETPGKFAYSSLIGGEPMIIGEWHGNNGANAGSTPSKEPWRIGGECWKRMPEWDERLKARMRL